MGGALTEKTSQWKVAGASVIGKWHEAAGGRCEDAWASARQQLLGGHEALAVCVSDGAGSAANGWVGAQIVCRFLADWLVKNPNKAFCEDTDERQWAIVSALKRVLRRAALGRGADLKSYACTIIAVLVTTEGKWLSVHLGDGGIVGLFDGFLRIVSAPRRGEFANETFFVTDNDAIDNIIINGGGPGSKTPQPQAFALFSDGVEGSLVNRHTGEVCQVLLRVFDWLTNSEEADVTTALETNLRDVFRERSSDDCSLVIIVQQPCSGKSTDTPPPLQTGSDD